MFEWMAWTTPVAIFFVCIVLMLIGMTVWEIKCCTALCKGFVLIETTRGDRLFVGLLTAAFINLAWVGLGENMVQWFSLETAPSVWISLVLSMMALAFVMRKA